MIRFLILIGLVYLLYLVITKPLGQLFGGSKPRVQKSKEKSSSSKHDAEEMAACALCGTFISRRDGETRGGQFVCKPGCHH